MEEQKESNIIINIPTPVSHQKIDPNVIKILKLNQFGLPRRTRRFIANKNKVPWRVYNKLEKEVKRRIIKNLDLETGKKLDEK